MCYHWYSCFSEPMSSGPLSQVPCLMMVFMRNTEVRISKWVLFRARNTTLTDLEFHDARQCQHILCTCDGAVLLARSRSGRFFGRRSPRGCRCKRPHSQHDLQTISFESETTPAE